MRCPPTRPIRPPRLPVRRAVAATLALIVLAASGCGSGGDSGDEVPSAAELTEEVVPCVAATDAGAGLVPSIDMGGIVVSSLAEAQRVRVEGGIEIPFTVEIDALDDDEVADSGAAPVDAASLAILQARTAEDLAVLLRADAVAEAGADRPGPASALSFQRCPEPVLHRVTLLVTAPGCLVLVANDPSIGGFTELPVRVEVDECTATPAPAPVG